MSAESFVHADTEPPRTQGLRVLLTLLRFAMPWKLRFAYGFVLLGLSSFAIVSSARLMGVFVNTALIGRDAHAAKWLSAEILLLEALAVVLLYSGRRTLASASSQAILFIRTTLFDYLDALPLAYYDRQPLGRTVTRFTHDVESLEDFFSGSMSRLAMALISTVVCLSAMAVSDVRIAAIVTSAMLPVIILIYASRGRARELNRARSRTNSAINAQLSEFLNGISVIRAFGLEGWSGDRFDETVGKNLFVSVSANRFYSWYRPATLCLCGLPLVCLIWFGGNAVIAETLSVGLFVTFVRYCERFIRPIAQFAFEMEAIQAAFTSAERVSVFLSAPTENTELGKNGALPADRIQGNIEFRGVSMRYAADAPALNDVSFSIAAGEKVGLAGATGSGKTTTVSLLSRLYEFQTGEILIDGVSIRDYDRSSLRSRIGFVSQDVTIFRGTVRDNLRVEHDISDTRMISACKVTGLQRVIEKNELTLDSVLLDGGANLSLGERQLVALTRVLLRDPAVLILDEATANVDPGYEKIIHDAVRSVMSNRTCLLIAHRLETLLECDHLFVFRDGKIEERGSHHDLIGQSGYYASLWATAVARGWDVDTAAGAEDSRS